MIIIGFDPGRDKCGVAVVTDDSQVLEHQIVSSDRAIDILNGLISHYDPQKIVMGNQTTSKQWQQKLTQNLNGDIQLELVNEKNSTVEGKDRYWQMYPPKGLKKLVPQGLRVPPRPVDDIVAIILIERYLQINT